MAIENNRDTENSRETQNKPGTENFIKELSRDVGKDLLRETGTTIKWVLGGALLGAVVLGGLGFWTFGVTGLAIGAIVGAVVGGVIGGWVYYSGSSLF